MPKVNFGTKDATPFDLQEKPDMIVVRTRSKRSVRGVGIVPTPDAEPLDDGILVTRFEDAGVEVYRVASEAVGTRSIDNRKLALRAASDVRFAGSVLTFPDSDKPVIYTENFYIRFREHVEPEDCERIIHQAGLSIKSPLDFAPNAYFLEAAEGTGQLVFDLALELLEKEEVLYCHPELVQERVPKSIFPEQWHLKPTVVNGVSINAHANVEAAHAIVRGAGVTVAIIDDGVDIDHPEFVSSGKIVAPRDASLGTADPRPKIQDANHGTACAGVAVASGSAGACGVAPLAKLMPIRLSSSLGSLREAEAFKWAADHGADVISCSWGPRDGVWWNLGDPVHSQRVPLPASTRDAIDYAATTGRGGKGCVILFAAGNGNELVSYDGYASYEKVIAVAACNDNNKRSVYSDFGPEIWCSFPSSDFEHMPFSHPKPLTKGIWTTDRSGSEGYNSGSVLNGDAAGNYTNDFGGTSSSCPGAAGVAALVLSVNPALTRVEVKQVLGQSCDRIDGSGGRYNSAGHSEFYGYGRLNALKAVTLAQGVSGTTTVVSKRVDLPIRDMGSCEASVEITESDPVRKLVASLRIDHSYIGDLVVTLIPPAELSLPPVILHNRAGGRLSKIDRQYDSTSTQLMANFESKVCKGIWKFFVEDKASQDSGTLIQVGLQSVFFHEQNRELTPPPNESTPKNVLASSRSSGSGRKRTPRKP